MARLHLDVRELPTELDLALAHLARGGEVLLERDGTVVAQLALPGPERPVVAPAAGDGMVTGGPLDPGLDTMAAALAVLRANGQPTPFDEWDELSREEEFLEMLATEEFE